MSINISALPNKVQLRSNSLINKEINDVNEENKAYTIKCNRVKNEILRKITSLKTDESVKVRIGFLNERDKNSLIEDISKKGYVCSLEKGLLTIE